MSGRGEGHAHDSPRSCPDATSAHTPRATGNYCVVTDYGVFANGTVSVRNRQRDGGVTGAYNGILG